MDRQYSIFRYTTRLVHDNKEGNSALELHATPKDEDTKRVARVVYWDAYGALFFDTLDGTSPTGNRRTADSRGERHDYILRNRSLLKLELGR